MKTVEISYANEGPIRLPIEEVEKWVPEKITTLTGIVAFKVEDKFVSMKIDDYKRIFKK